MSMATDMPPEVIAIREKIASGELSANAPCDGMYNEWAKEDETKFKSALDDMFGWKK